MGSFIYITGENDASINSRSADSSSSMVGLSHGDYVVNSTDGKIFAVVGEVSTSDAPDEDFNSPKELKDDFDVDPCTTEDAIDKLFHILTRGPNNKAPFS